jgi:hypothetical protein
VGIRESLNQNPNLTTGLTALVIIVAVAAIVWQISRGSGGPTPNTSEKAFFTIDDGKTTFADDISKLPPFDHQGKPAVRAYVFACKGGKIRFVGYLERYTTEGKAKVEEAKARKQTMDPAFAESLAATGIEVKQPMTGDKAWLLRGDPKAATVMSPKCPDGSDDLEPVFP